MTNQQPIQPGNTPTNCNDPDRLLDRGAIAMGLEEKCVRPMLVENQAPKILP